MSLTRVQREPLAKAASSEVTITRIINSAWAKLASFVTTPAGTAAAELGAETFIRAAPWGEWMAALSAVRKPMAQGIAAGFLTGADELTGITARAEFNAVDALSQRYAETQAGKLIKAIGDTQRETIRGVLGGALGGQYTTYEAAMRIRDSIGLHPHWAQAVVNLRERVFASALKDGATVAKATALADRKAAQYSKKLIKRRAENIARTETITAENLGRYASWVDAVDGGVMSKFSRKEWNAEVGDACDKCKDIDGETVPWDQPFSNGVLMPPAHPGCRCSTSTLPPMLAPGEPGYDPELDDPDHLYGADYQQRTGWQPLSQTRPNVQGVQIKEPSALITGRRTPYTLDNTRHLSDDELDALIIEHSEDPDALDNVLEVIDQRDAERNMWGKSPDTQPAKYSTVAYDDPSPKTNPAKMKARNLDREEQVAEQFDAYVATQYARALEYTAGNFLNAKHAAEAASRGLTSETIFLVPGKTAKKFASEELIAFWEENGRHSYTSYRYQMFNMPSDRSAAETVRRLGWQGKAPSADRSTF
ncbi:capsid maturation protease [Arthrobacter phage LiSara]|uniref:Capsid maturation protease n=1 Tax=Arthrobacter phage LiSara TaxID=2015860 RepID=A0A222ZHC7_9CAUD|nr:head maturation protease [Arthrobacter phage LiSara]ASR83601.1 capsid maturation protease [Arthrobacter phage LiSara]